MATIKDVAKEANVSIGTVSNVINEKRIMRNLSEEWKMQLKN